jgi:type II secretory ATPase GspE/PulE/Tfp pilus assembly ATPase PilB-like protein
MPRGPDTHSDAPQLVASILKDAVHRRASDIHLEPTAAGYDVRYRIDGLLETIARHEPETGRAMVGRLMVLAQLLTYRLDIPQEGRLTFALEGTSQPPLDLRLAIMPTAQGLRAAIRLPADLIQPRTLDELGLSPNVLVGLERFARADSGMLILTGPAGSGKTTTIYALLRYINEAQPGLSIITLEDPVERHLSGATQIEVKPFGELTYERALRSILRQDPQVLMLGEIRDAATASLALQAALSGHRLICTLHASDPAGAIARLYEMGMEPYQITSALFAVVSQRLIRRREGAGYSGRVPVAEFVSMDEPLRKSVSSKSDADTLRKIYEKQLGYVSMRHVADDLVGRGITDRNEVQRVLASDLH